jgi:16S rRNA (cytosine967-C5)-methyltransferase
MDVHSASVPLWQQLQAAAGVVQAVRRGQSGTAAMEALNAALRPGVQALTFQVWRNLGRAEALRDALVDRRPPPATDALLCTALALLWDPQAAPYDPHTLVNQAVQALKQGASGRAHASFINACLRRFLREHEALVAVTTRNPQAQWNHPVWWIELLQDQYPEHWKELLQAANGRAPMTLRVNLRKCSVAQYLESLRQAGIEAHAGAGAAVTLARPVPVGQLPHFAQGWVAVQDAAAQIAAPLLLQGLGPGARLLDACAAPGGKTAHLRDLADGPLLALDADGQRLLRVGENLQRMGVQAELRQGDAAEPSTWWDGQLFDGILLDAPCTASGIVRRHPDVRWLRRPTDVAQLAAQQRRLLEALWPLLAPGGRMVYCTCSLFAAEGTEQISQFLARHNDAHALPAPGHMLARPDFVPFASTLSPTEDHDSFFYALLEKRHH